jgi:hypothetical protein
MKSKKIFIVIGFFCALCAWRPRPAGAEPGSLESQVADLTRAVRELTLTVENQEREIALLKGQTPPPFTTTGQPPASAPGGRSLQGRWNPDIGAVADTVVKLDSPRSNEGGADRVSLRELELVLGSPVDPYSRLDATISFSDVEAAALEEAYYTHFGLPFAAAARVGKFKPRIGKVIGVHRDSIDTVDEPLVIRRYFGEEGYNKSGADVKIPLELPWEVAHELTLGVLEGGNGDGGTLFGDSRRRPTLYAHLKNYVDLNDVSGLELGGSYLVGSRDDDATFEVNVLGLDATLIHRYADQRHVKFQSEAFLVNKTESFTVTEDPATLDLVFDDVDDNRHLWGGYFLADWRFHPQWATGFRFDRVMLVDAPVDGPDSGDTGYTGYLTFYQSEFARWRAQVTRLELTDGHDDNQILVQGTFAIGEHKHKLS